VTDDVPAARRRVLKRWLRVIALMVALAAGGWALASRWDEVGTAWSELSSVGIAGTLISCLVASILPFFAWRALLADAGSRLPLAAGARVYFLAQLGKYVPGSVWAVVAQVDLARELQVPARRSATISLVHLALACLSALLVAAAAVPASSADTSSYWWVFLLVPVLVAGLHPRVVAVAFGAVARILRRPADPVHTSVRGMSVALAWFLASWVFYGLHYWFQVRDLGAGVSAGGLLLLSVGGFALAWVVGLLVVVAPAGAGARELVLALLFAAVLTPGAAVLAALLSRVVLTIIDLALAGLAVLISVRGRRQVAIDRRSGGMGPA
jgi:uncharacterized membrane protein YbhN (UPF0104 family)